MLRKLLKAMTFQPKSTKTIPVFFLNFFKQTLMKLLKQVFFQSKEVLYKAMKNIFVESNVKMLMQKQFLKQIGIGPNISQHLNMSICESCLNKHTLLPMIERSSHRKCSVKKGFLRNFIKFTRKHLCQSLFFNKVAGPRHFFYDHLFYRTPTDDCFWIEK